eukprot:m.483295 g.483295  ORF g.483295 m.483295 type:complete len:102 (-) comp21725_c0_seq5:527-832(-)
MVATQYLLYTPGSECSYLDYAATMLYMEIIEAVKYYTVMHHVSVTRKLRPPFMQLSPRKFQAMFCQTYMYAFLCMYSLEPIYVTLLQSEECAFSQRSALRL